MSQTQMNIKVDSVLKQEVDIVSADLGLNASDVVRVFLKKFVALRGFPFPIVADFNSETILAMEDVKCRRSLTKVESIKDLKKALES